MMQDRAEEFVEGERVHAQGAACRSKPPVQRLRLQRRGNHDQRRASQPTVAARTVSTTQALLPAAVGAV
ncbi:MAG: hypothetical protein H6643_00260 [Caldilineaceae bacterium]|nr:hypothetical protein [Caldilineaceae bacterium]